MVRFIEKTTVNRKLNIQNSSTILRQTVNVGVFRNHSVFPLLYSNGTLSWTPKLQNRVGCSNVLFHKYMPEKAILITCNI